MMNILILNGSPDPNHAAFDRYMQRYQLKLHHLGHYVKTYQLRNLKFIHGGVNRWGGDLKYIYNSLNEADLVVFASPLMNGHLSDQISDLQDRIILHFEQILKKQAANHYEPVGIPLFGVLVMPEPDTTEHDLLLCKLTQERIATNIHTILSFFITTLLSQIDAVCETLERIPRDAYNDIAVDSLH